jgi:gas vesicle protein
LNAREELDKAKKNLKEFLDARVSWSGEVIAIDMNMFNSDRGRPEGQFETVVQVILMARIDAEGEDVNRIADQWEAFAKSKKYKNAWWELFDKKLAERVLKIREEQKESSKAVMAKIEDNKKKIADKRSTPGVQGSYTSAAAVDTDFADDDLI